MTLKEAVARFDALYPNALDIGYKRRLISGFDGRVYSEVLVHFEGAPQFFAGYGENADPDTQLLVEFPFDDIYIKLLCAENDAVGGDTLRYANSAALFNAAWEQYVNYINRTRRRKKGARLRL